MHLFCPETSIDHELWQYIIQKDHTDRLAEVPQVDKTATCRFIGRYARIKSTQRVHVIQASFGVHAKEI